MFWYFLDRTGNDGKSANRKKKTTQKTNGSVEEEWDRRDTYIVPKCIPLIKVGFYHDVIGWRAVSASRRHLLKGGEHLNTRDVTASSPRTEPPRPAAPRLHTLTHTRLSRDGFLVCLFCLFFSSQMWWTRRWFFTTAGRLSSIIIHVFNADTDIISLLFIMLCIRNESIRLILVQ